MKRILTGLLTVAFIQFFVAFISAADLVWDGDGVAPFGGSGTWDTTSPNWRAGGGYQAWDNSSADNAIFDTVGGDVSSATVMNVHNMSFNVSGYSLLVPLNLVGTTPSIYVSADASATISAGINAVSGFTKTGPGLLDLQSFNNVVQGTVKASEGVLRLGSGWKNSNLNIAGGVVELNCFFSPISTTLGTGQNQMQFTGSGGFSAYDPFAPPDYDFNVRGAAIYFGPGTLNWGQGGFVPDGSELILSSPSSNATIQLNNSVNLGTSTRTIRVNNGVVPIDATIGGLSGSGGLIKVGDGALSLGMPSSYAGPTTVTAGVLEFATAQALPGGMNATGGTSNLNLAGGAAGLSSLNFNRALGTGPAQVQFTGTGGFTGSGTVNLGGNTTPSQVVWGSGSFVPDGATFILGSTDSIYMVKFMNPIGLGSVQRTIRTDCASFAPFMVNGSLRGALSGNGGLKKTGNGVLELAATNTYSGETQLTSGVLILLNSLAVPGGIGPSGGSSHLLITGGGELKTSSTDFQRNLGPNSSDVQFSGSGGFFGGTHHLVNFGGASAPVSWDNNPYLPDDFVLALENVDSAGPMELQNPLVLGAGKRTITGFYGSGDTHARLSGTISGIGGLKKTGGLVLELTTENSYTGETEVNGGILRLTNARGLPGGSGTSGGLSNLNFSGNADYNWSITKISSGSSSSTYYYSTGAVCVVELTAENFTRALGTGPQQVQFTGNGGFSAYGANRVVNLGGDSAQVTWGANHFVPQNSSLCFSSLWSNATVDFQNPIDLGALQRSILVDDGSANVDARLNGVLSGSGGLIKDGFGTLVLNAVNTYQGTTTISSGKLILGPNGTIDSTAGIELWGATFDVSAKQNGFLLGGAKTLQGNGTIRGSLIAAPDSLIRLTDGDTLTLSIWGNLTLELGAKLDFILFTPSSSNKIKVSSSLILDDQQFSDFTFSTIGGFGPGTYVLIDATTIQGELDANCTGSIGGLPASLAISGSDLVLTVVPEPSTIVLLGAVIAGGLGYGRRRRKET
jgi:autotransporter-associated beta strand protein